MHIKVLVKSVIDLLFVYMIIMNAITMIVCAVIRAVGSLFLVVMSVFCFLTTGCVSLIFPQRNCIKRYIFFIYLTSRVNLNLNACLRLFRFLSSS